MTPENGVSRPLRDFFYSLVRRRYNPDPMQRYRGAIDRRGDFSARNPYQYLETGESATMRGSIDRFGYGRAVDSLGNQYRIHR